MLDSRLDFSRPIISISLENYVRCFCQHLTDGLGGLHLERFICPSKRSKRVAFTRADCLKRDVFSATIFAVLARGGRNSF